MINHHLSDEMILAYAAGALSEGQAMVVHCHLEYCDHCAARLREAEALGGALLEELDVPTLTSLDFDDMFAKIEVSEEMQEPLSMETSDTLQERATPAMLRNILGHGIEDVKWKRVGPGIRQYVLPLDLQEGENVRLLRLSPGFVTPMHTHRGSEMTLVLQGSFCDETGRYAVGDIQDADGDLDHQPVADTDVDCICLAVTTAPLQFRGLIGKLMQPLVGI
ncbi:MAG: ChrR family anti-sigma-E factor [Sneathiellales bacterium]|nr:ChrR family anti-sigma-E factor [Sneathiellales bacterium]